MKENQPCSLSRTSEGLVFTGDTLTYRITGLTAHNLDRLRITLKANPTDQPGTFHIDTLDLYYSRARESFSEACAKYMKAQQPAVMAELSQLVAALEAERIAMRERGSAPVTPTMSDDEQKEAIELLKSKDLLNRIISDFDALGLIGERHNKLLGYVAAVSRLMPDPLGVLVLSRSGAGKTCLQDAVCKFVPPEQCIQYTRLTGQSLFYRDANSLKNKLLAIEEEEGMQDAMYSIRTLQSSQKLSIASTRTDAKTGKMSVDEYTVYGPVVVMISTTNPEALDPETRQRFLILTIDESEEQTKSILNAQRQKNRLSFFRMSSDESSVTRTHHNMQRLLRQLTPVFPDELEIRYPYGRLQMRREQGKYLSLIKAIALLHQYQRKTGTLKRMDGAKVDYVMVDKKDVELALELGRMVFHRNVDDVSPTGRRLLAEIARLVTEKYEALKADTRDLLISQVPFTRKELREQTGWSEAQVRQNIGPLAELGYIGVLKGQFGSTFRYVMLDDGSHDPKMEL